MLRHTSIVLNRPDYVGFTEVDVSKEIMYDFRYVHAARKFDPRLRLLMTDTDSLLYSIKTSDLYEGISILFRYYVTYLSNNYFYLGVIN